MPAQQALLSWFTRGFAGSSRAGLGLRYLDSNQSIVFNNTCKIPQVGCYRNISTKDERPHLHVAFWSPMCCISFRWPHDLKTNLDQAGLESENPTNLGPSRSLTTRHLFGAILQSREHLIFMYIFGCILLCWQAWDQLWRFGVFGLTWKPCCEEYQVRFPDWTLAILLPGVCVYRP